MMLPELVNISEAKVHDSKGFERVVFPKDTIIIKDKGYWDFDVIKARINTKNTFVTRIKLKFLHIKCNNPLQENEFL